MNERIVELAKQADVLIDYGDDITVGRYSIGGSTEKMEKFAELIIQECAEVARQTNLDMASRSYMVHKAIKDHFGVE